MTSQIIYYILSALLSLLVLRGISMMSNVESAANGNRLGALSMLLAIVLTLWYFRILTVPCLWCAMLIGAVAGLYISIKVDMIQMPQMVGLLNGFGGLASMLAGVLTLLVPQTSGSLNQFSYFTAGLAIVIGGLTWSGSAVAAAKLHRVMDQRSIELPSHQFLTLLALILSAGSVCAFLMPQFQSGKSMNILIFSSVFISNLFGYIFAIRVGGADMPITISLLNSFSGVAGAIAGMAIGDLLLVSVGGIVGASGLLLTQIMCRSMNRSLSSILLGKTSATPKNVLKNKEDIRKTENKIASPGADSPARILKKAESVIIVPGYGMALSQAQPMVKQLVDTLESDGKKVRFAIHPVAGRMPGHMNVLLAEVDIPYDKLFEMDTINPDFADTDAVVVIGANDVINPAANTAEGTPIYGMPVLNVADAENVIICNFDEKCGYAGVPNPLYEKAREEDGHVRLLLGDAKDTLRLLLKDYTAADISMENNKETDSPARILKKAESVIIVPGYGMALSQAQPMVKQLVDTLESDGKKVRFAIHPVAGRMPGHMNVLLAEVDIPYDKLFEMDTINPDFADTDAVVVIGANDVINPAANTAEGTPIYGMPVLNVADAENVIICNFDEKCGYAGVPNPLYEKAREEDGHVRLLLGDAKDTLRLLLKDYSGR